MRIALAGQVIELCGIDAAAQKAVDDGAERLFGPYRTSRPPDWIHVFDLTLPNNPIVPRQMQVESSRSGDIFSMHIANQFRGQLSVANRRSRFSLLADVDRKSVV